MAGYLVQPIATLLQQNALDAILISSPHYILHLTNFSYFSKEEREAFLLLTKDTNYIFTDARYSHAVRTQLPHFELAEISIKTPFTSLLKKFQNDHKITKLGIEEDNLTVTEYKRITTVNKNLKHINLKELRIVKTTDEMKKIKKACAIGDQTSLYILKHIKPGMTEKEIAMVMESFIRQKGANLSFPTIVAFGKNAAIPHHRTGLTKLKEKDLILLDFGVDYENYCSDMTRTFFIGKITEEQEKIYHTVSTAQLKAIKFIKNKLAKKEPVKASDVDKVAREFLIKNDFPSIPHSLGHGIGLQVHEAPSLSPNSKDILTNDMVFSIEPGIYLPDKFGVRIEDLFSIQNNKLIQLTKSPNALLTI